ncbi:MAG: cytochrome d ubiquinol oxidase subunit II [Polyangiales bacterium]
MSLAEACAGAILLALIAYGVLAGADFGGGVWDALARGPRKDAQRAAIARAMGPVWEANHVWLIFVIVLLFTVFPAVFRAVSIALFVPFHLALVGIILRGAAFAFRSHETHLAGVGNRARVWGVVFGVSSVITPVLLGMCFGAVSSGGIRVGDGVGGVGGVAAIDGAVRFEGGVPWLSPFSWCMGGAALSLFAYLAAVFLCVETTGALQEDFRRRALGAGTIVVVGAALTVPLTYFQAPHLWTGLTSVRALPVLVVGFAAALVSGHALLARRPRRARLAAIVQVVALLVGWSLAQRPYLVYPDLLLEASAAEPATMRFVLGSLPIGAALIVPSLWLLFRVFKSEARERGAE